MPALRQTHTNRCFPNPAFSKRMYDTQYTPTTANITEVRTQFSDVVDRAKNQGSGVLISRNNEPYAVITSVTDYNRLKEENRELKERIKQLRRMIPNERLRQESEDRLR